MEVGVTGRRSGSRERRNGLYQSSRRCSIGCSKGMVVWRILVHGRVVVPPSASPASSLSAFVAAALMLT